MTSISSSTDASFSPFPRVQNAIQRDVSAGTISATDETALTSALGDIASQLSAGASSTTGAAGATTTPTSMKDRVGSLIDNEVSSGKLTTDQATELKTAFEQAHAHMHGAHNHHRGGEGMLAALGGTSSTDAATTSTGSGSPLATAATNAVSALEAFITQFKSAVNANGLYGSTGTGSNGATSLLVNSIG